MRLVAPKTLEEVLELKAQRGADARVLAGGQSLAVMMQKGLVAPELIIYIGEIKGLGRVSTKGGVVTLGPLVTSGQVEHSTELKKVAPLLHQVCSLVASPHVRNLGTVVGNLCHAEVGTDPPQALLALDAEVQARSVRGERWIPISDFALDFFTTALEEDEIATAVRFKPFAGKSTYIKNRVREVDLAVAGVAVAVQESDGKVADVRIAVGGTGPRPLRATGIEAQVCGLSKAEVAKDAEEIGWTAAREINPTLSDSFGSVQYRRRLVAVSVRRGLERLLSTAG